MNQQIIAIAQQLEAEGIKWDFADYVVQTLRIRASSLHEAVDPYLLLTAAYGDIGAVIMTANDKLVYYYWEGLGGARGKDRALPESKFSPIWNFLCHDNNSLP